MAKRIRSPNYPAISLPDAVERLAKVGNVIHSHPAERALVLDSMGYRTANGASLTVLAAMGKYGLLQRDGEDYKITERGMMYLHPNPPEERIQAIREAAAEPKLFADLSTAFSDSKVSDELLRSYLLRNGFTPQAASTALRNYRETMALVEQECGDFGEDPVEPEEGAEPVASQKQAVSASAPLEPPVSVGVPSVLPAPPSSDPFEVTVTDKIKGWFNFDNQVDLDDLISVLNAVKKRLPESRKKDDEPDNSEMN